MRLMKNHMEAVEDIIEALNKAVQENDDKSESAYKYALKCLDVHIRRERDGKGWRFRRAGLDDSSLHVRLLKAWVEACNTGGAEIKGMGIFIALGQEIIAECMIDVRSDRHLIETLDVNSYYLWFDGEQYEWPEIQNFSDLCDFFRNQLNEEKEDAEAEFDDDEWDS